MDRNLSCLLVAGSLITVALRKESVDRNGRTTSVSNGSKVALRKESVDRNLSFPNSVRRCLVALRKESVDRNRYLDNIRNN